MATNNKPRVLILHATGTNRDHDAAWAVKHAGGQPEIVHINQLREDSRRMRRYQMMILKMAGLFMVQKYNQVKSIYLVM